MDKHLCKENAELKMCKDNPVHLLLLFSLWQCERQIKGLHR